MASCPGLACLELTSCEGLWDGSLAATLEASPGCLANLTRSALSSSGPGLNSDVCRFCVRGNHRGDISLTERSVSLLRRRAPGLTQLGDCFTWSLSGAGSAPRSALWLHFKYMVQIPLSISDELPFSYFLLSMSYLNNATSHSEPLALINRLRLHIHLHRSWGPRAGSRGV